MVCAPATSSAPPNVTNSLIFDPSLASESPMIDRTASSWAAFPSSSSLTRCSRSSSPAVFGGLPEAPRSVAEPRATLRAGLGWALLSDWALVRDCLPALLCVEASPPQELQAAWQEDGFAP